MASILETLLDILPNGVSLHDIDMDQVVAMDLVPDISRKKDGEDNE